LLHRHLVAAYGEVPRLCATGIDPRRDRIVELAVITVQGDGTAADR
jgi:hypothetical protein